MKKRFRGSYTIEATIVFSAMLIALCAVMFAFMIMYQHVILIYAASYGAQQGARAWVNTGISMDGTTRGYNSELYSGIAELWGGGLTQTKKDKIKAAVDGKLKLSIFSTKNIDVDIQYNVNILPLKRDVTVDIKQEIPIPFSGIVKFFNNGNPFAIKAKMKATVVEPTEYIRNMDYAIEWVKVLGEKLGKGASKSATDKLEEILKGMK